jgi:hypothetical protein
VRLSLPLGLHLKAKVVALRTWVVLFARAQAPLVGCSQTAVGWTDHLLVDGLLGGVVNVVGGGEAGRAGRQRVIDLSAASLPFIDGVPLVELAKALDELAEWHNPSRPSTKLGVSKSSQTWRRRWRAVGQSLRHLWADAKVAAISAKLRPVLVITGFSGKDGLCERSGMGDFPAPE